MGTPQDAAARPDPGALAAAARRTRAVARPRTRTRGRALATARTLLRTRATLRATGTATATASRRRQAAQRELPVQTEVGRDLRHVTRLVAEHERHADARAPRAAGAAGAVHVAIAVLG